MADESDPEWCIVHEINLDRSYDVETFFSAIKIWVERPQVLNRRLAGSYVFQSFQTTRHVEDVLANVYSLSKESGPIPQEKLLRLQSNLGNAVPHDNNIQENVVETQIRKLLPRQSSKHKNVSEFVIQDRKNKSVMFVPFEDETSTEVVSKIEYAYKISLHCNSQSLALSVLSQRSNGDGITCPTIEWLKLYLLPKLYKWMQDDGLNLKSFGSSLRLVPVENYIKKYEELKKKYKHFVKMWPERTDPQKFVYEDVAIATYLLLLWGNGQDDKGPTRKVQTFVDLGCGNGLLVHILANEGHLGKGIDLRPRKVWKFYDNKTDLQVTTLDPSCLTYPDVDWIIGNHSDELTPWIPVVAARSSYNCKYFVLPCCFHDFYHKFQRKSSNDSQYRSYLNYVQMVGQTCGFEIKEDVLRIPSTKKVCQIGEKRMYLPAKQDIIERNITAMLQKTTHHNAKEKDKSYEADLKNETHNLEIPPSTQKDEASLSLQDTTKTFEMLEASKSFSHDPNKACKNEQFQVYLPQDKNTIDQDSMTLIHNQRFDITTEQTRVHDFKHKSRPDVSCKNSASPCQQMEILQSLPSMSFVPRADKEPIINCTQLDKKLVGSIIQKVATELLSRPDHCKPESMTGNAKIWNKGGCMELSEVAGMFDQKVLDELRSEAGGIQTVLRNSHQVFRVQDGMVKIRDWQRESHAKECTKKDERRKRQTGSTTKYWKTKPCWFYNNHPDGCPLLAQQCSFAHGTEDIKIPPIKH